MPSTRSHQFLTLVLLVLLLTGASRLARAQTFQVLHTFQGPDGANPEAPVTLDAAGNIYGTTPAGGAGTCTSMGCGTVFVLNKAGREIALHSFRGPDGAYPQAGLLRDSRGNLFGTADGGGKNTSSCGGANGPGCGVAFRFSPKGKEVEYKFQGTPDGWQPTAPVVEDNAGNLYGTTYLGGEHGLGAVFKIQGTSGKETVLYSFTGGSDGCFPYSGVILDSASNLYGVTFEGGSGFCNNGLGVVFRVDPDGNETVLHTFSGRDGAGPDSALLFDSNGNLYGTTENGGSSNGCGFSGCGVVFEVSPQQGGQWLETVLYSFCSLPECADGEEPGTGPLVRDLEGNLFGTTYFGGSYQNCNGDACGVVFELDAAGNETVLHSFTGGSDGAFPAAGLTLDTLRNLYGTTENGGTSCYGQYTCGVVFKITP
jgi:uncharacterized repeat protein (TIGR03803 family)